MEQAEARQHGTFVPSLGRYVAETVPEGSPLATPPFETSGTYYPSEAERAEGRVFVEGMRSGWQSAEELWKARMAQMEEQIKVLGAALRAAITFGDSLNAFNAFATRARILLAAREDEV